MCNKATFLRGCKPKKLETTGLNFDNVFYYKISMYINVMDYKVQYFPAVE